MMEFENLSERAKSLVIKTRSPFRSSRAKVVLAKLSGLNDKFNDFSQELNALGKSGIKVDSLLAKLEEIVKLVEESKSRLKSGGKDNAKKDS